MSERLRASGPLPIADVLKVGVKISAALHYAHSAGVLHRDIKPENIFDLGFRRARVGRFRYRGCRRSTAVHAHRCLVHHQSRGSGDAGRPNVFRVIGPLQPQFHLVHPDRRDVPRSTRRALTAFVALVNMVMNDPAPSSGRRTCRSHWSDCWRPDSPRRRKVVLLTPGCSAKHCNRSSGRSDFRSPSSPTAPPPAASTRSSSADPVLGAAAGAIAASAAAAGAAAAAAVRSTPVHCRPQAPYRADSSTPAHYRPQAHYRAERRHRRTTAHWRTATTDCAAATGAEAATGAAPEPDGTPTTAGEPVSGGTSRPVAATAAGPSKERAWWIAAAVLVGVILIGTIVYLATRGTAGTASISQGVPVSSSAQLSTAAESKSKSTSSATGRRRPRRHPARRRQLQRPVPSSARSDLRLGQRGSCRLCVEHRNRCRYR